MMKITLVTAVVILISKVAFGQLNGFREREVRFKETRDGYAKCKIKEIDRYRIKKDTCLTCRDSTLYNQTFISPSGAVYKTIRYVLNREEHKYEPVIDSTWYDANGYRKGMISGKNTAKPHYSNFIYNTAGQILQDDNTNYLYNEAGNMIFFKIPIGGALQYDYNSKNQVVKEWLIDKSSKKSLYKEYRYKYIKDEIIQTIQNIGEQDIDENVYNLSGQLLRSSKIKATGEKVLKRSNMLNDKNQITESLEPMFNRKLKKFTDNLEHRFYTYDDEGDIIKIVSFELDKETGKETLLFTEVYVYKKYN